MRQLLLVLVGLAALVGVLYAASLSQRSFECEACMTYAGNRHCSRVAGAERAAAERAAINNACSALTSGVTRSLDCQRSRPLSLTCEGG